MRDKQDSKSRPWTLIVLRSLGPSHWACGLKPVLFNLATHSVTMLNPDTQGGDLHSNIPEEKWLEYYSADGGQEQLESGSTPGVRRVSNIQTETSQTDKKENKRDDGAGWKSQLPLRQVHPSYSIHQVHLTELCFTYSVCTQPLTGTAPLTHMQSIHPSIHPNLPKTSELYLHSISIINLSLSLFSPVPLQPSFLCISSTLHASSVWDRKMPSDSN